MSIPTSDTAKRARSSSIVPWSVVLFAFYFEMQNPPNPSSERLVNRPPSRSPSPMSTVFASAESETSPREGHTESQELRVLLSNQIHERPVDYRPVAAEDVSAVHVQRPSRKMKPTTLLLDCVVTLLPIAFVVFVALVWSMKDSRVIGESYVPWENAIKTVSGFLYIYSTTSDTNST